MRLIDILANATYNKAPQDLSDMSDNYIHNNHGRCPHGYFNGIGNSRNCPDKDYKGRRCIICYSKQEHITNVDWREIDESSNKKWKEYKLDE